MLFAAKLFALAAVLGSSMLPVSAGNGGESWHDQNQDNASSGKPAIVFCHGAFLDPSYLYNVSDSLRQMGHEVYVPTLATHKGPGYVGIQADADIVKPIIQRLVERENKEVVLVAHSYGGGVCTEALLPQWGHISRSARKQPGCVIKLIMASAGVVLPGQSPAEALGGGFPEDTSGLVGYQPFIPALFSDLGQDRQAELIPTLSNISGLAFVDIVRNPGYVYAPVEFIHFTQDMFTPVPAQNAFVATMKLLGATVTESSLDSGHIPWYSNPQGILNALVQAIG